MSELTVDYLSCEQRTNPLGVDVAQPRLSWQLQSSRTGTMQAAYQMRASPTPALAGGQADVWCSDEVATDRSQLLPWPGPTLQPQQRVYWQVRVQDDQGLWSGWSPVAFFETGLLGASQADWAKAGAEWIGAPTPTDPAVEQPVTYLRRSFEVPVVEGAVITSARLRMTARGVVQCALNDQRVGADEFAPGWTEYDVRKHYVTYDVTDLITGGANEWTGILGEGWFCGRLAWGGEKGRNGYGTTPAFLGRLDLHFSDGTAMTIGTDADWQQSTGPIQTSSIYDGEVFDARLQPAYDQPVTVHGADAALLQAKPCELPLVTVVREAQTVTEVRPGIFVFDFGQNLVGVPKLQVKGQAAGNRITLRFAEMLQDRGPDAGMIYTENLRDAKATDVYLCSGNDNETYVPAFTFHGYRYCEVSGIAGSVDVAAVQALVIDSVPEQTGSFECSHDLINQLHSNILWGQRGNFIEIPTDCPQRNERLGWTGDIQVFGPTACRNFASGAFLSKWVTDLCDGQYPDGRIPDVAPDILTRHARQHSDVTYEQQDHQWGGNAAWADAVFVVPWTLYETYGDQQVLADHYDAMVRWLQYCEQSSTNLIRPRTNYGDWLATDAAVAPRLRRQMIW
jgi:alpha-L-rhamnosidase